MPAVNFQCVCTCIHDVIDSNTRLVHSWEISVTSLQIIFDNAGLSGSTWAMSQVYGSRDNTNSLKLAREELKKKTVKVRIHLHNLQGKAFFLSPLNRRRRLISEEWMRSNFREWADFPSSHISHVFDFFRNESVG